MTQIRIDHYEAVRGPANAPGTNPRDSITRVTIGGEQYLRFYVEPGDVQAWDTGNVGPNGEKNERAEVSAAAAYTPDKPKGPFNVREGMLQTYDVDFYLEAMPPYCDEAQHLWMLWLQFHPDDAHPEYLKGFSGVSYHNGQITIEGGDGNYFVKEPVVANVKMQRRLVVNWSATDGYIIWADRSTAKLVDGKLIGGRILGRHEAPTIAKGSYHYGPKWGQYRAGKLPAFALCIKGADGIEPTVNDGDLTIAADAPPAQPDAGTQQLAATLAQIRPAVTTLIKSIADAQAFLDKPK
jgi:hypothetical protein